MVKWLVEIHMVLVCDDNGIELLKNKYKNNKLFFHCTITKPYYLQKHAIIASGV